MKQDMFNSVANGDLPLLANSLLCQQERPNCAASETAIATSRSSGFDPALVQAQWAAVLAHVSHTAERCACSVMVRQLKAFGVKRTRTVVISLAHEYVKAGGIAASNGFMPSTQDVLLITRTMRSHDQLSEEFRALANAYRLLLVAMAPRDGGRLFNWLSDHASVHDARARNLAGRLTNGE